MVNDGTAYFFIAQLDIIVQVGRHKVKDRMAWINVDSLNVVNSILFDSDLMITKT
jgi:hypothetical protein